MSRATVQSRLIQLPAIAKRLIVAVSDACVLSLTLTLTLLVLHQFAFPANPAILWLFPAVLLIGIPALASQRLYRAIIRFVGSRMIMGVLSGTALITMTMTLIVAALDAVTGLSLISFALVFYALGIIGLVSSRFLM
ncbi:MAG: hypothetical protein WAU48_13335, partial [Gammaproteobacteria bacterium]